MKVMMMSSFDEHIHFSRLLCDNLMLFYFWSSLMSNDFVKKVNRPLIDADAVMIKYSYLEDINMRKYKSFIILAAVFLILTSCRKDDKTEIIEENTTEEISDDSIICGDERFADYLPLLEGKRVALFTNQTGIVGNKIITADYKRNDLTLFGKDINGNDLEYGPHILDVLIEKGVNVTCVFSPEHGFRGSADAGAAIDDSIDEKTGVPLLSLYSEASVYPSDEDMERFDVLVADMQDVGLRYYTYYISLYHLMDACNTHDKTLIVLDRPNPNGYYIDGPIIRSDYYSNVGALPIPVVYGLTWGELALMINGEGWLKNGRNSCDLKVIECQNYDHQKLDELIISPSPNLKDMRSVYLYASTCFFEKTVVSVGRGTMHPFEIYGSPYFEGCEAYGYTFVPESMSGAAYPQFEGELCYGRNLMDIPLQSIIDKHIDLSYLIEAYSRFHERFPEQSFFGEPDINGYYWIDYLSGSDELRKMIIDGYSEEQIKETWKSDLEMFEKQRQPYLLYAE